MFWAREVKVPVRCRYSQTGSSSVGVGEGRGLVISSG